MKTDRLLGIVIYLLNHGRTSARGLAAEFEVSPRTIVRDIEAISISGIPVRPVCGAGGGYELMEDFVLDKRAATRDDMVWIAAALKGLSTAYAAKDIRRALDKLSDIAPSAPVSLDLGAAAEDKGIAPIQQLLDEAIRAARMVCFTYTNSRGDTKTVGAEPVQLIYRWYSWYLAAYDPVHDDYRMYKLVRMADVTVSDHKNSRIHDASSITFADNTGKVLHIRLHVRPSAMARCREYLNGAVTTEYPDGSFEFCFSAPEHEFFWFGVLMALSGEIKVLEPPEVIERITRTCKEVLTAYGDDPL